MTPKLPVISGAECIKALEKAGYEIVRQSGSHIRLRDKTGKGSPVTVSNHQELRPGLLQKILKDAELTAEKLSELI